MDFIAESEEPLNMLENETSVFIGRKKNVHQEYGEEGALLIGKSVEKQNLGKHVFLDALSPHVIFATGSRGSGKSYSLGVIAEELTIKNPNVASVIIDPIGIFWSMKYPNKDAKELESLAQWGLEARGIKNVQVFVPEGMKEKIPKQTYDKLFSLRPVELNADDWCLTFGLERFSPTGLLLEKVIDKAKQKFKNHFGLEDLIQIAEKDNELTSKDRGFKQDTRRALASRLEAAKTWGILSKEATDLSEICKEGYISIIDISFLEENVASLVIGMLAKKILNARKLVTRKESVEKYMTEDLDDFLNVEIPATWLFIDEAHTLIPSGNLKTAATDALIEYVKQGRRPGCSLVFATQQPSAIDTRVLSQLDLILCHKLVFDQDLGAVMKRMPTLLPKEYEKTKFLKTLPIGIALAGDRSELTNRAFCLQIRPRYSQHEGREMHTLESDKIDSKKLEEYITDLTFNKLQQLGTLKLLKVDEICDTMNRRYKIYIDPDKVTKLIEEKGAVIKDDNITLPGRKIEEEQKENEEIETPQKLNFIKSQISEADARKTAEKFRQKKTLGMFGNEEKIKDITQSYEQIYKINFDAVLPNGYKPLSIFVDHDYEIIYWKGRLMKTKDVSKIVSLDSKAIKILDALRKTNDVKKIEKMTALTAQGASRILRSLVDSELVVEKDKNYQLVKTLDIPTDLSNDMYKVDKKFEFEKQKVEHKEKPFADEAILKKIPTLFVSAKVKDIEVYWKPIYLVIYESKDGERIQKIDAI